MVIGTWLGRKRILEFLNHIGAFLFSGSGQMSEGTDSPVLVFAISSGIIGVLVIILDFLMSLIARDSFLNLTHRLKTLPLFVLVWGFGAALVSFLGVAFSILQTTLQAAVIAGVAWPVLMTRIVSGAGGKMEPEEIGELEEKEE